jgi:putative ABC transport system permease protein
MHYLSYWRRHRLLAAAVVATVAVGTGASAAVYSVVEAVVVRSLPVREPERLVWMWNARVERDRAPFSVLDFEDYRDGNTVLDGVAPFTNWTANLTGVGDAERLEGLRVDPSFFRVLGVTPARGRLLDERDGQALVAVLSDRLWRRRFGADPAVVGQMVSLNGVAHAVVGVLPPGFVFPFRDAEIAVPLAVQSDARRSDRGAGFLRVVARLRPGVSLSAAKANLDAIGARLRRDYPDADSKKLGVSLFPLGREIVGDARSLLLTLLGAVLVLLFVACANITNLLLVAFASRRRELAVRAALGATRRQIGAHLLGEIAALVVAGGACGLVLGTQLTRALVWWGGSSLPRLDDVGPTPGLMAFALATTLLGALYCGIMPAWLFSETSIVGCADDARTASASAGQGRFRRGFVALQIAASVTLLAAMMLAVLGFRRLQAIDPGFDGRDVLSIQLALPPARYAHPAQVVAFADALHRDLADVSRVRDAAAISLLPLSGLLSTQDYEVVGQPAPPPDEVPQAHYRIVTPGYFRIMGIGLRGREFGVDDREATRRVAVISRTLADRHWPGVFPIGEHIVVGRDALEVVGVCEDVKQFGLDAGSTADLYVPLRQMPAEQSQFVAARMYWVVKTSENPMGSADAVRAAVRRLDKDIAASSTRPVGEILTASAGPRRFNTRLIEMAGAASLLLATIGVYGVAAFSLAARSREIGIRRAFGARPLHIVKPILGPEWCSVAIGLAVGGAGAVFVSRSLAPVFFAPRGVEPWAIAAAAGALGVVAFGATLVPVRRALRTDPLEALRAQ